MDIDAESPIHPPRNLQELERMLKAEELIELEWAALLDTDNLRFLETLVDLIESDIPCKERYIQIIDSLSPELVKEAIDHEWDLDYAAYEAGVWLDLMRDLLRPLCSVLGRKPKVALPPAIPISESLPTTAQPFPWPPDDVRARLDALTNLDPDLHQSFELALELLLSHPRAAATELRRMLQDMSKFFAPVTDNLASSIRTLDDKLITSQMHTVRVIGNIAAHDEHPLTTKDVLPALFAMLCVLEWWHETA